MLGMAGLLTILTYLRDITQRPVIIEKGERAMLVIFTVLTLNILAIFFSSRGDIRECLISKGIADSVSLIYICTR